MKLRRLLSVLLALTMMAQVLPLSAIADGSEEVTEYVYVTDTVTLDDTEDPSNDELFEGYVEQLFGISSNDGIMTAATYTGEDALSGAMLDIYKELKSAVAKIASGEETSAVVSIPVTYTASYYGVSTGNDAWSAFSSTFSSSTLVNYLLHDCPYEMYWFDKQTGMETSTSGYTYSAYFAVTITFTFYVASDYQDTDNTTVDSEKVATAVAAAEYAQEIAETYKYYTEIDKINAFKEIICELASYDHDAAADSNYPYGDIWQLVYVFDQDEETKVVCEGYSKAFQYLCDLCGVDCITVTGYNMSDGSSGGSHMWNVVYYDGVNYLVDVTNSDAGTAGQNGGLFMVCADEATAIYDGTSGYYGYIFTVNNKVITYTYDTTTLSLYPYEGYLALGNVATGTTVTLPSFYGKALTLDGEIGVTYYFTMDDVTNPDDYYLMAKFADDTYYVKYDAAEQKTIDDVTYYHYTVYVNPTQINSSINAYLTDGTNKVELDNYSVYDYCAYAITTETEVWQKVEALCEAVLNYGYYAEKWYNNGSSALQTQIKGLDKDWTDPVTNFSLSELSDYAKESDGIDKTLALDGGVYIRVYVTDTTATYTVDGEKLEVGEDSNGYYVEFKVYAKEMYKTFTVLMNGNTYTTYSVYTYIYNVCNSENDASKGITDSLKDLCKSIYYYGELARDYTNWN
ncbi:MAG: hypothetical protein LUH18_06995 [Oscillospiraceae bacterium]|nr:hypothetical protein [Oscillospiraceae bacterium]